MNVRLESDRVFDLSREKAVELCRNLVAKREKYNAIPANHPDKALARKLARSAYLNAEELMDKFNIHFYEVV